MAPTAVLASHATDGAVDRTRPLCVYPQVAVYTGSGSTDDAANFECRDPGR
jgi:feruloyl esterase